jgi:spoIIIJ-associated protein
MQRGIEIDARSVDEAIEQALQELRLKREQVSIQVLDSGTKGFLGLFGSKMARVRVVPNQEEALPNSLHESERPSYTHSSDEDEHDDDDTVSEDDSDYEDDSVYEDEASDEYKGASYSGQSFGEKGDPYIQTNYGSTSPFVSEDPILLNACEVAKVFVTSVLERITTEVMIETYPSSENSIGIEVKGEHVGVLIGRKGECLEALQYLTCLVVNKSHERYFRVSLDIEDYRKRRENNLIRIAERTAKKAEKFRRSYTLDPMSAMERRLVHSVLQRIEGIVTYSTGSEPFRRIVIKPAPRIGQ